MQPLIAQPDAVLLWAPPLSVNGRLDCAKSQNGLELSCAWITFFPRPATGRAAFAAVESTFEGLRALANEHVELPPIADHYAPGARETLHAELGQVVAGLRPGRPGAAPPAAPSGLTARPLTRSSIRLTWTNGSTAQIAVWIEGVAVTVPVDAPFAKSSPYSLRAEDDGFGVVVVVVVDVVATGLDAELAGHGCGGR